jgi:hypothetical protein
VEISFKTKEHPEARTANVDIPETLEGLVAKYGEESVVANARGSFVISAQAYGRRHIEKDQAELQSLFDNWNPNERAPASKKSAFEKATSALSSLSAEEKAELLARLQAG